MRSKCLHNFIFIFVLVFWITPCVPINLKVIVDHPFNPVFNQSNARQTYLTKRQTPNHIINISPKACTTASGLKGICVPSIHCPLSELSRKDFWTTIGYLCIIENKLIGICCMKKSISKNIPEIVDNVDTQRSDSNNIELRSENRGCGLTTKEFPRIMDGRQAEPDEWPWMAAIFRRGFPNVFCGGVLISDRHVLTAAHCTNNMFSELFVRLGEYNIRLVNETRIRDFKIIEMIQHINFDPITYDNDISLLRIDRPTIFNTYIWPICLPPPDEIWEKWDGVVIGWGTKFFGGPHSNILMEVSVPIWEQNKCKAAFLINIGNNVFCAGAEEGGRDSCQGDSGGPLLVQLPNRRWIVVGIVSWGLRCGEKGRPGLYTMVTKYIPWIIENSTK